MNRASAEWELIKEDQVTYPGEKAGLWGLARNGAVKGYDVVSGIAPAALGFMSDNEFETVRRTSPISATIEEVRSTLKARWFKKGNPLNIGAKVVEGIVGGTDALIDDALHLGDSNNGSVIRTVD